MAAAFSVFALRRAFRNDTMDGSLASQIGSSRSQPPCGSSAMTRASPWIVARTVRPPTLTGSVMDSETCGSRSMCSSLRLNNVDEVRYTRSPSYSGISG